jgi:hypothetical protein
MPKRTIYLSEEDAKFWDIARRAIKAESDLGIGTFLARMLRTHIKVIPQKPKTK